MQKRLRGLTNKANDRTIIVVPILGSVIVFQIQTNFCIIVLTRPFTEPALTFVDDFISTLSKKKKKTQLSANQYGNE